MLGVEPVTEVHRQYSSQGATATRWAEGRETLEGAEVYWLATVRPEGRPHVTPLVAVWLEGALYFCTGPDERKTRNLARNPHCVIITGCNALSSGLDLVVEGDAVRVTDEAQLQRVAECFNEKYGRPFQFTVRDGVFWGEGGEAVLFELWPATAFGFGRGESFSQTRWRF